MILSHYCHEWMHPVIAMCKARCSKGALANVLSCMLHLLPAFTALVLRKLCLDHYASSKTEPKGALSVTEVCV